jgi:hypothetical protein
MAAIAGEGDWGISDAAVSRAAWFRLNWAAELLSTATQATDPAFR